MIQAGFLDPESRRDLIELARDGSAPHRLARRANALVLLDQGMSCGAVAQVLFLDDDTIRTWFRLYQQDGFDGLLSFGYDRSACRLSEPQQDKLKAWITETLPRTTGAVGAWIEQECGITYESRSGLVVLLHRLGMEHRKPQAVSSKLDPDKEAAFIQQYEALLNQLGEDEAAPGRVLGAEGCADRHAAEQPPPAAEHSRCARSRDRPDPDDRGGHGERDQHDHAAACDRGAVSGQAADPFVCGQCSLPSRLNHRKPRYHACWPSPPKAHWPQRPISIG